MAAATSVIHERGTKQFQGMFKEMWAVKATWDPASADAGAQTTSDTITVPGVALGDMVMVSPGVNLAATGELFMSAYVSAANTVTIRLSNVHASSAADLATSTWKLWVGRPSW